MAYVNQTDSAPPASMFIQWRENKAGLTDAKGTMMGLQQRAMMLTGTIAMLTSAYMSIRMYEYRQNMSNMMIQNSMLRLKTAQETYAMAALKFGPESEQATKAHNSLIIAQNSMERARMRADMEQQRMWFSIIPLGMSMMSMLQNAHMMMGSAQNAADAVPNSQVIDPTPEDEAPTLEDIAPPEIIDPAAPAEAPITVPMIIGILASVTGSAAAIGSSIMANMSEADQPDQSTSENAAQTVDVTIPQGMNEQQAADYTAARVTDYGD